MKKNNRNSAKTINKIGGNTVTINGGIGNIEQNITDNSGRFNIEKKTYGKLEKTSKHIYEKYGYKLGLTIAIIELITGILAIFNSIFKLWPEIFKTLLRVSEKGESGTLITNIYLYIFIFGVFLFVRGLFMLEAIKYKKDSKCSKCKKDFAYKEVGQPIERHTKISNGYHVERVRKYKCRFCGYQETKTFTWREDEKGREI